MLRLVQMLRFSQNADETARNIPSSRASCRSRVGNLGGLGRRLDFTVHLRFGDRRKNFRVVAPVESRSRPAAVARGASAAARTLSFTCRTTTTPTTTTTITSFTRSRICSGTVRPSSVISRRLLGFRLRMTNAILKRLAAAPPPGGRGATGVVLVGESDLEFLVEWCAEKEGLAGA